MHECAIIGGGPAGLNAALVLGRARRDVVVFDSNKPRNAVTHESHGFLTRDGVKPAEFRKIAHEEIAQYPSVRFRSSTVTDIRKESDGFALVTSDGTIVRSKKVMIATGLKETLPSVDGIHDYYGKSLFNCPYCDGWELRDRPLVVISEGSHAWGLISLVHNWSKDLIVCTNGNNNLDEQQKEILARKNIPVYEQKIIALNGANGLLESIVLEDQQEIKRAGGFVSPIWEQAFTIGEALGCETNETGSFVTDAFGRTTVAGVYAAGDSTGIAPSQLVIAAGGGSRAAIGVNIDLTQEEFI